MADVVVSEVLDRLHYGGRIPEQIGAAGLAIRQEAFLSDLNIEPVHGNVQPGGQLGGAEQGGIVGPAVALRIPMMSAGHSD
ncbi:MAG TPA: hypothetical protein VMU82_13960 [Acetobacteraceae bacterium]|nr:hypothetical protein [Acetobacteraceae bacterium]